MNYAPIQDVLPSLRAAQRRIAAQTFLTALAKCALLAGAALVVLAAVNRWMLGRLPYDPQAAAIAAGAAAAVALLTAIARRQSLAQVAAVIDRLGVTRDRFLTALAFSSGEAAPEMRTLAVKECAAYARGRDFGSLVKVRMPRELAWLVVPAVAVALLQWEARENLRDKRNATDAAKAEVEDTAKKLEELAHRTEQANEKAQTEDLKKIAEQMKRSAEQLRANATNPEDAAKSALRELSALEELVKELQKEPAATPEEMKELAKALAQTEETKEAASAMEAGDTAKAAEQLEKALKQLEEKQDTQTAAQIQQALEQALKRLAEQKQLSEALQKLAQQMQRGRAGEGGESSEAMRQLAQLLKQMQRGQGQPQSRDGKQSAQTLKNLLAALQNMKYGEGEKQGGAGKPQEGNGAVAMESFATGAGKGDDSGTQIPSGQPGGEHDTGTTDSPFGKERNDPGKDAQAKQLTGRLGEGESLSQYLPSAGDSSKSNRRYKELYEALAPAAEEAVTQENIPLGSRFFIKRYFESIRPKE